jgi:hypothetical protein
LEYEDLPRQGLLGIRYEGGRILEFRAVVEMVGKSREEVIEAGKMFGQAELIRVPVQVGRNRWRGRFVVVVRTKEEAEIVRRMAEYSGGFGDGKEK